MTNACTAYREADVRGASPIRLIVLLYDQMIKDVTHAAQAFEQNEIELRTKLINHAILVIGHLQSPLDFANGGKVAQDLDHFYDFLRQNLVQVQFHPSKSGIDCLITDLLAVRGAWIEVERAEKSKATVTAAPTAAGVFPPGAAGPESERAPMDWKG